MSQVEVVSFLYNRVAMAKKVGRCRTNDESKNPSILRRRRSTLGLKPGQIKSEVQNKAIIIIISDKENVFRFVSVSVLVKYTLDTRTCCVNNSEQQETKLLVCACANPNTKQKRKSF